MLEGTSGAQPLLQQLPAAVTQESIQVGLEFIQRRRLYSLCVQPAPALCHLHSKVLSSVLMGLPVFQFVVVLP